VSTLGNIYFNFYAGLIYSLYPKTGILRPEPAHETLVTEPSSLFLVAVHPSIPNDAIFHNPQIVERTNNKDFKKRHQSEQNVKRPVSGTPVCL
jgi:hypothetical protein